ncbi:methyltransferase domain-containing protein [Undibacterium seohonense]|jgi:trans-aconitate methyltransferase|uniref:Methyltransferase domain-containing protein n=1 Tax=Undibacterium seohonense TaxID=1344950 RepID=A0ABR6X3D8_9BURK|nr:methyltransferase domain-containing protein [Undibacterium seohonense]MBC3807366.1 methyltransferase domain-containing protein [Undibacterium seohonense]
MHEASKALSRRLHDSRFATRYFVGNGIDIGCGPDPVSQYAEQFPLMKQVKNWDMPDGDAQYLASIADQSLNFVHSSHCLEHMVDPKIAFHHWLRVLQAGGHMIITIPDEDLYEQGQFPSSFNSDHKWTFTIHKQKSWSAKSINLLEFLAAFSDVAQVVKLELLDATYRYQLGRFDQTLTPVAEAGIEIILRKLPEQEIQQSGRYQKTPQGI